MDTPMVTLAKNKVVTWVYMLIQNAQPEKI